MEAQPLGRPALAGTAAALAEAFWDYSETVHLLPDQSRRRHVLPRYLLADCADSEAYRSLLGVILEDRVVGAAAWLPPEAYPIPIHRQLAQVRHLLPALPWALSAAREARRGQLVNRLRHPKEPHFYLRAVGVVPAWQGRGVGHALLTPILAVADQRGVGCFLTTTEQKNLAFYDRFGFAVVTNYYPTPTWPEVWGLWREPR